MFNVNPNSRASSTAFFYCARSTAEPERAKPAEIMGALLRQLASSKPDLPVKEPVAKEYEARRQKAEEDSSALKKLTVQDCTRLIIELTKDHPATIIVDALDECEENTRYELLEAFDEVIRNSAEVVKVFVSSRDDIDIVSSLLEIVLLALMIDVHDGPIDLNCDVPANRYHLSTNCAWKIPKTYQSASRTTVAISRALSN